MGYGRDEDWDSGVGYGAGMEIDNADGEVTWIMCDGTSIRIVDMSNKHLQNTLRMLERNGVEPVERTALVEEARRRGLRW